jgi:glycosyltransferase involved in cell wall biosynthesis
MKILFVINSLGTGGAEKLLLDTLPLYKERGIEADLLLLWDNDCMFTQQLRNLNCCKIFVLKKSPSIKVIYNPLSIFKIAKILKDYDLAHVHLFPSQYFVVLANKSNGNKTKLIYTEHNSNNRRLENSLYGTFDKYFYKSYDTIVCISQEIKGILLKHTKLPLDKFHLIENGVNLESINKAIALTKDKIDPTLNSTDIIVMQVAGFRSQKDQYTLIKAMALLPKYYKLVLVGDGVLKKDCETLVSELKLQKRILFLGARMDIPQLLKTTDIVVLSSKFEGLSLSSIEGMASGKPFIASGVSGLQEVVKGAGVLFPVGEEKQLASEISKLIDNPELYASVANACQKRAKEYDIKVMVEKHVTLYRSFENN